MFRRAGDQAYPPGGQNPYGQPQVSPQYKQGFYEIPVQQNQNANMLHKQQQQQQQQQQHQQQQMQQQHQQGGAGSTIGTADGGSGSGQGQEMNLASVMHYLQSEWRRWERDRNEWEIERAEMRARIALLEGQRRSAENLKVDLLRRVKMLEFALRQERTRTVSSTGRGGSLAPNPNRLSALQDEEKGSKDDKEGSGSEGSQEDLSEKGGPKSNGIHPAAMGKSTNVAVRQPAESSSWKSIGSALRDPKSRARSREYLKQCLQEISYLTSPGALNPLPPQPPVEPSQLATGPGLSYDGPGGRPLEAPDRPKKGLPEEDIPSMFPRDESTQQPQPQGQDDNSNSHSSSLPNGTASVPEAKSEIPSTTSVTRSQQPQTDISSSKAENPKVPESRGMAIDPTAKPPSSPAPRTKDLPDSEPHTQGQEGQVDHNSDVDQSKQILTAIYRPDSKAAWREELRTANEEAEKAHRDRSKKLSEGTDEDTLASLTLNVEEDEVKPDESSSVMDKVWTSRRTLKSHLDIVRSVAFAHGPGILLASGGDDCTVKVWATEAGSIVSQKPSAGELEPIITFRGHTSPVTTVVISTAHSIIFSGSLDSTIRLWRLPSSHHDQYSTYDPSFALQTLEGHTDAIWDLVILPPRDIPSTDAGGQLAGSGQSRRGSMVGAGAKKIEGRLVSASADGTIKIWEKKPKSNSDQWTLEASFGQDIFDQGEIPTSLEVSNTDYGKVLVGTTLGRVKVFDCDEAKVIQTYGEEMDEGASQVNAILSHPTLPAIIVAHEDGYLRFYDAKSASPTPTHIILAHPSPVTSLSISPLSPTCILTASVDCTVRLWDLQKKTSIQDLAGHRPRSGEGVCAVASHPELPVVATAGGDGVVRLWGAG